MCKPKPYYTGKQCAVFFLNNVYINIPTSLLFCVKPNFLNNMGNFAF